MVRKKKGEVEERKGGGGRDAFAAKGNRAREDGSEGVSGKILDHEGEELWR